VSVGVVVEENHAMERVAVVGAGQAGLAVSHELALAGIDHVVLERGRVGQRWKDRWDSFCLVTPNWTAQLPGHHYQGDDPHGYMSKDEVVAYLQSYSASVAAPVREEIEVAAVAAVPGGGFALRTSAGDLHAGSVVLATGAYQRPHRPPGAETIPADLPQIDVTGYRNPWALPPGKVLVVGSGQSGAQIAEELHQAGREVVLACGRAPWTPRRIGEHDMTWWAVETGFLDVPADALPAPVARLAGNVLATGHGGGHDLHLRTLRAVGVTLTGHFLGVTDGQARFAPDLGDSVAWGDQRHREFMGLVRKLVADRGLPAPDVPEPGPFDPRAPERLPLAGFGVVVFAGGFRPDYGALAPWPDAFDAMGFPVQRDGASTAVDGLYFAGVHFLRKRKSSLLLGSGRTRPWSPVRSRSASCPSGPSLR
jgi:pyridine nucleotide-disulfide oxidoreductase